MRRVLVTAAMVSLCLSGCATDKSFEKEILGHPAPESQSDTGWSRSPTPPPSPPPVAYAPPPAPRPVNPVPVASMPPAAAEEPPAPKLFTPPPAATRPVIPPAPVKTPARPSQPIPGAITVLEGGTLYTFQVGEFAHAQTANTLMGTLKARGYTVRLEQGKRNTKTFYKVFAAKAGGRAALEGELLTLGVLEPRLTEERPVAAASAAPAAPMTQKAPVSAPPAPVARKTSAPVAPAPVAPRPTPTIAPPVVEPAPPLPDGYVPPPPKNGS